MTLQIQQQIFLIQEYLHCFNSRDFDYLLNRKGAYLDENFWDAAIELYNQYNNNQILSERLDKVSAKLAPTVCTNIIKKCFRTMDINRWDEFLSRSMWCMVHKNSEQIWLRYRSTLNLHNKVYIEKLWERLQRLAVEQLFLYKNQAHIQWWLQNAAGILLKENALDLAPNKAQVITEDAAIVYFEWGTEILKTCKNERPSITYDVGIEFLERALVYYKPDNKPHNWAAIELNRGIAYIENNKIKKGIHILLTALPKTSGNTYLEAMICRGLSLGYLELSNSKGINEAQQALDYARRAVLLFDNMDHNDAWASAKTKYAQAILRCEPYLSRENLEISLNAVDEALTVYKEHQYPEEYAGTHHLKGILLASQESITGMEKSIIHFQIAAQTYNSLGNPVSFARCMGCIAEVEIKLADVGKREDYVVNAIDILNRNLKKISKENQPQLWAHTWKLLALAYEKRSGPDSAKYIEQSISACQNASKVFTFEEYPLEWGRINQNLAYLFFRRIIGDKGKNVESAIAFCKDALLVINVQNDIQAWGDIQTVLGACYSIRLTGDKDDNNLKSIECFNRALSVFSIDRWPHRWAQAKNNLGAALIQQRVKNFGAAIEAYQDSLKIFTKEESEYRFAQTICNLAYAYGHSKIQGDFDKALKTFDEALAIYTKDRYPDEWSRIHVHLGVCWFLHKETFPNEAVTKSLAALDRSLEVTDKVNPYELGMVYANMAKICKDAYQNIGDEMYTRAVTSCLKAMELIDASTAPWSIAEVAGDLGELYYKSKDYVKAIDVYNVARNAIEDIRLLISSSERKERLAFDHQHIYKFLVTCYLENNQIEQAYETVCLAKSRSLAEKLVSPRPEINNLVEHAPDFQKAWAAYSDTWNEIQKLKQCIDKQVNAEIKSTYLLELENVLTLNRQQLEALYRQFPILSDTITIKPITVYDAKELAKVLNVAIVEYFHTNTGWIVFIVTPSTIDYKQLSLGCQQTIEEVIEWIVSCSTKLPAAFSSIKQNRVLTNFYNCFIGNLTDRLEGFKNLLIVPHEQLHLLPLGLAKDNKGLYLQDSYSLSFMAGTACVKSLVDMQVSQSDNNAVATLLVSFPGSPPNELIYAAEEVRRIKDLHVELTLLEAEEATPERIIQSAKNSSFSTVHFSCHGTMNHQYPELSGLELNGTLTVERIINELHFQGQPVVSLGACLSGFSAITPGDELIGLNQALLQAGALAIIGSLWPVNDYSTMLFFHEFYKARHDKRSSLADCLRVASKNVREVSGFEHAYFWGCFSIYGINLKHLSQYNGNE